MKTYAHKDGYTYYYENGALMACPTNGDGTMDKENFLFVDDFAYPLKDKVLDMIINKLR